MSTMETKICQTCSETKKLRLFPASLTRSGGIKYRPHCYSCKYKKEVLSGRVTNKQYLREYYASNKLVYKYKAYRHGDIKKGLLNTISRDDAVEIMMQPCSYCGVENGHGLDRLDNTLGHNKENVVSCCEKCNYILGDLPVEAKKLLASGLKNIRKKGYLNKWEIPTKRKKV